MKKNLRLLTTLALLLIFAQDVSSQYYKNQGYWKKARFQLAFAFGTSNFLGELGGRNKVGSDFIWDLETKQFKPAASIGFRYFFKPKLAIRAQASYAVIAGDDALTTERFRSNRNLHFKSPLYELAVILEANIHTVRPGHRYNLSGVKGRKPRAANIYAFAGVAGIRFDPKAKIGDEWYNLQPLNTEGQGLDGETEPYSLYSLAIPMGIGYRSKMAGNLYLGIEIGHRMTFSDYLDDVSTTYYDNDVILNSNGFIAAYLADPSLGFYVDEVSGENVSENMSFAGQQRGDATDNDAYLFAQLTLSYRFTTAPYKRRKPSKKRGRRVVF